MTNSLLKDFEGDPTTLTLIDVNNFNSWKENLSRLSQNWVTKNGFEGKAGEICWLPEENTKLQKVAVGWDGKDSLETLGHLPYALPEGVYKLVNPVSEHQLLGWLMGSYKFNRYKAPDRKPAQLIMSKELDIPLIETINDSVTFARDLINTPANEMGPSELTVQARNLAKKYGAEISVVEGKELIAKKLLSIYTVGQAATDEPKLIDISWGNPNNPRVTIVGKGVCFDSGGLNIKPSNGIRHMKKDMGGAAVSLGLASLIMEENLPIRLRLLIGAVENAISGNAYRPGDVIKTYKGLSVEIDNTDAEGRLIMCDCLALAAEERPSLVIDFSTLTGSARSAVGAEISAMFCNDDSIAKSICDAGERTEDPIWRLPLHKPYRHMLKSNIADMVNSAPSPYAGAITAALFLENFINDHPWVHFDINAFNTRHRPGRPEGGEAMAMRAIFDYLKERFGE